MKTWLCIMMLLCMGFGFAQTSTTEYLSLETTSRQDSLMVSDSLDSDYRKGVTVKINALGVGLLMANAAVEVDFADRWSFHLPVYYSGWNYFKPTLKFRTLAIQPEVRYWFDKRYRWFVGAHFGMGYYNFAFDGDYRYQDHNRETPALGGGVSVGYRLPLSENKRWQVEFVVGGGAYRLHYDKFHNVDNVAEGQLYETKKKTYWGVDNVAISFSYKFEFKKRKEGNR